MTFFNLKKKQELIDAYLDAIGDEQLITLSKFLKERINCPESYVTMLGETSSGKSTLINGLLKKQLLYTSPAPSTGTIIEVSFDADSEIPEYYAVNRSATMEALDEISFTELSKKPDEQLARLRVAVPEIPGLSGLRLFDTPGYGSIVDSHEEILREFIPSSDVILYVVGYRIGIQQEDFMFMRYIQELIHEDTEVAVIVNRCPTSMGENDRRIREIREYADDLFHRTVPVFCVPTENSQNGQPVLPAAESVWNYVGSILASKERQHALVEALNGYLDELLSRADAAVERRELAVKLDQKERDELAQYANEYREKGEKIINEEIIPFFDRAISNVPRLFEQAKERIIASIQESIEEQPVGRMKETITYVNQHLLPISIERETQEYQKRLMLEMDEMNRKVDDYLNEATEEYTREVKICFSTNAELAVRAGGGKILGKVMENGLTRYFASFGGAGGARAGVANATKHFVKKFGDLIGKKFSRETYNSIAHFMKKIGATSAKAVGNAVTVIIELLQVIVDYSTWKGKLKKRVAIALDEWCTETTASIKEDLGKLREDNANTLRKIINDNAEAYSPEEPVTDTTLEKLLKIKKHTHKILEEEHL